MPCGEKKGKFGCQLSVPAPSHFRMDTMFYWFMGVILAFGIPIIVPIALEGYRR